MTATNKPRALKILAVHRYYWPDTAPYATILRKIVGRWRNSGHNIEVLSSQPSYKIGVSNQKFRKVDHVDGSVVYRLNLPNELGKPIRRILNGLKLGGAILYKAITRRYDIIMISTSPPILGGMFAAIASKLTGARFIYHCMDIHPEIGRISGEFSNVLIFKFLLRLDQWICCQADPVVVLSSDMENSLRDRTKTKNFPIVTINNFSLSSFNTTSKTLPFVWPEAKLTMIFAGNIGRFQGLGIIIDAMKILVERNDIHVVMMGDGAIKHRLQAEAEAFKLNITFISHQALDVANRAIKYSDVGFVGLRTGIYRYAYPSKTMAYLQQGCPIIVAVEAESELSKDVLNGEYGYVIPPGEGKTLADLLVTLSDSKASIKKMQLNAICKTQTTYSEAHILDQWENLISDEAAFK